MHPWNGGREGTRKQEIQNKEVERRLLGKIFFPVLESTTCSVGKASRMSQRKKRDEAAAKNGDHEILHKENQIKRKNGR